MDFVYLSLLPLLRGMAQCHARLCEAVENTRSNENTVCFRTGFAGAVFPILLSMLIFPGLSRAENNQGSVEFERNDRILTWQNRTEGIFQYKPNLKLNYSSDLSTSISMATGSSIADRWFDRVYNKAQLDYRHSDRLGLSLNLREEWNRDSMSGAGNSFLTADGGGSVNYRPFNCLNLTGNLGQIRDERFENQDSGTTFSGEGRYVFQPKGQLRNLSAQLSVRGGTSTLRRTNDSAQVQGQMAYVNPLATVSLEFGNNRTVRGYFAESTSETGETERKDIEERTSYERNMTVRVSRGGGADREASALDLAMTLQNRRMTDSANDKDPTSPKYHTNSNGNLRDFVLRYSRPLGRFLHGEMESEYSRNENDVQKAIRSRTQTDVSTRGSLTFTPGASDSIAMVGWIKRTRIDTPSEVHNDRDELKIESGVKYTRNWAENFYTGLDFRVLETHYVNIDVTQSSQNKWMRTFVLAPSFNYIPVPSIRIRHEVGVQADYIDFDFDRSTSPRSTITRRVSSETWITGDVSENTQVIAGVMFEENDYGKLNTRGSKIPVEEGIRRFLDLSVRYTFAKWMVCVPKYVYAIRKDRSSETGAIERREIDQTYGMDIRLFGSERMENRAFVIGCKRIVRETIGSSPKNRNYISMTLNYGF